ncbi:hypothetical protein J437_LFUL018831 [Ladona fulva]|uniref:Uncharacterized protein n=1 Tax=Ladona fulva TaxID=123851 RepID=A0A8K0KPY8_LADFU|nr:hypothetical protein J437_LFUL018831 [Ladona fulva]
MHLLRTSGDEWHIIYLDETWVNQNHSRASVWQYSDLNGGLEVPTGVRSRMILAQRFCCSVVVFSLVGWDHPNDLLSPSRKRCPTDSAN